MAKETKLIPLLGYPLGHTISPRIQNVAYGARGIDAHYFPLEVRQEAELGQVVSFLRGANSPGFAITAPYKVAIIDHLDELDDTAQVAGAVNTAVNCDGKLIGYNTDGVGFCKALDDEGVNLTEKRVFCLGAGGAARAILFALAAKGVRDIVIASRSDSAAQLAGNLCARFGDVARAGTVEDAKRADALLNFAGVGMEPRVEETWIDKKDLSSHPFCFDAAYAPEQTRFLREGAEAGCKTMNGLGMLIHQGMAQIDLWFGKREEW